MNKVVVAAGVVFALFLTAIYPAALLSSRRDVTVTVSDKERVCDRKADSSGQECKYLVYTSDGTFENTDSVLAWKWNSSDVYGGLKTGQEYTITVQGWRLPFFSMYPNITNVK